MNTLLLISVGPVQEFIASARKLRDLWIGSHLLSELSKTVARTLAGHGAELIFPAPTDNSDLEKKSSLVVANKILARVSDAAEAERLQNLARQSWRAHLDCLGVETIAEIEKRFHKLDINKTRFKAQVIDYGDFFAVWTEIEAPGKYRAARARVEQLLAARKNLREFMAPMWDGSGVPKNSLDGFRECVTPENAPDIRGLLKKNEKLDAMGCIKRFSDLTNPAETKHFADLADVALVPWLMGLENKPEARELISAFQQSLLPSDAKRNDNKRQISKNIPLLVEAECFFAPLEKLQEINGIDPEKAWQLRSRMVKACGEPSHYSVIMVGDGDHMGKMIDAITSMEIHKTFSRKLSEFAREVEPIIREAGGSLIYAGGDDVMAYLPLHQAISCADAIRKKFHDVMKALHDKEKLDCEVPTFSAGLAIVHHSCPLDQALDLARKAEKLAKTKGQRNALALIQSKRSGSELKICGKWDADGYLPGIAERIASTVAMYNEDNAVLPSRLGYELRRVLVETGGNGEMKFKYEGAVIKPDNATAALVKRIFDHKNDGNTTKNVKLSTLLSGRSDVAQFADELVIVRQVAEAVSLAQGGER